MLSNVTIRYCIFEYGIDFGFLKWRKLRGGGGCGCESINSLLNAPPVCCAFGRERQDILQG